MGGLQLCVRLELTVVHYRSIDWEVVIVDDASPDGTQDIAKQLQTVYGHERIVSPLDGHQHHTTLTVLRHSCCNLEQENWVLGEAKPPSHPFESELFSLTPKPEIHRSAYIHGLQYCTGQFVIIMDADFSHHVRAC